MPLPVSPMRATSPTRRAWGGCEGGRDRVAVGDPNYCTEDRRSEARAGRANVARNTGSLVSGLSWSGSAKANDSKRVRSCGANIRQTFNHSSLHPARGGVCTDVTDKRTGRRPSPEKHRNNSSIRQTKPVVGLHQQRWNSSIRASGCNVEEAPLPRVRGKLRTNSPQKTSAIGVSNHTLTHDAESVRVRRRGNGAGGIGSLEVQTAGLTSSALCPQPEYDESPPRARKNKSASPSKYPTQVGVAMHAPPQQASTKHKQQWVADMLQNRAHLLAPAGAASIHNPGHGARRPLDGSEAQRQGTPRFISTWEKPVPPQSPVRRISITGSPKRGYNSHSTSRLLAWG